MATAHVSKLHPVTLKAIQEEVDKGHPSDVLVDHFHKELGTQKTILIEEIKHMVPGPGTHGDKLLKAQIEAAAKAAAEALAEKDKPKA